MTSTSDSFRSQHFDTTFNQDSPASTFHSLAPESIENSTTDLQLESGDGDHQTIAAAEEISSGSRPQSSTSKTTSFEDPPSQVHRHTQSNGNYDSKPLKVGKEIGSIDVKEDKRNGDGNDGFRIEMEPVQDDHPLQRSQDSDLNDFNHQEEDLGYPRPTYVDESQQISRSSSPSTPPTWPSSADINKNATSTPNSSRLKLKNGWFSPSSPSPTASTSAIPISGSGPSLTAHYLPTKFSTSFNSYNSLDPRRGSHSSLRAGIPSTSSSTSFKNLSPRPSNIFSSSSRNRLKSYERDSRDRNQVGSPSKPPLSSSNRVIKRGAGREAWGPDGNGEAALGAGDYEDDDGIDLDWNGNDNDNGQDRDRGDVFTDDLNSNGIIASQSKMRKRKSKRNKTTSLQDDPPNGRNSFLDTSLREKANGVSGWEKISRIFGKGTKIINGKRRKLRWNRFKWFLFCGNLVLTIYSLGGLIGILLTWARVWNHSEVVIVTNRTELILGTIAASLSFITSLIGWSGILLNNRAFLSIYTFMLWISFAFIVAPGYVSYKRKNFNLEGKLNNLWSRQLNLSSRKKVQDSLNCCGYFSPFVEAVSSPRCYSRSILPGCKGKLLRFERETLLKIYAIAFGLVPLHLGLIFISLLCSNHVTYRFGKGIIPKAYRLNASTAQVLRSRNEFNNSPIPTSNSRTRLIPNSPFELSNHSFQRSNSVSMEINGSGSLLPPFGGHQTPVNDSSYANTPLRNAIALPGSTNSSRTDFEIEDKSRGGKFSKLFKR